MSSWAIGSRFTLGSDNGDTYTIRRRDDDGRYEVTWDDDPNHAARYADYSINNHISDGSWKLMDEGVPVGRKMTIPSSGDGTTAFTIAIREGDTYNHFELQWISPDDGSNQILGYSADEILGALRRRVWVLTEETTVETTATPAVVEDTNNTSESEAAKERAEAKYREVVAERNALKTFKDEMLDALCVVAADPSGHSLENEEPLCGMFDAWMIRQGYTREEVDAARERAKPDVEINVMMTMRVTVPRDVYESGDHRLVWEALNDNDLIGSQMIDDIELYD